MLSIAAFLVIIIIITIEKKNRIILKPAHQKVLVVLIFTKIIRDFYFLSRIQNFFYPYF